MFNAAAPFRRTHHHHPGVADRILRHVVTINSANAKESILCRATGRAHRRRDNKQPGRTWYRGIVPMAILHRARCVRLRKRRHAGSAAMP